MPEAAISIQLWTVRAELEMNVDSTLAQLASIGFANVEPFDFVHRARELSNAFAEHGLSAPTGHAPLVSVIENPFDPDIVAPGNEEVFAAAQILGMSTVIDPFVAPERWQTLEEISKTAELFNQAAAAAAKWGLTVGYHNHNQELLNQFDGKHALEVFADLLDPAVVLEIDLYWATAGGADTAALVSRLRDRVVAVHFKDGTLSPVPSLSSVPTDQVPAGRGVVPLDTALAAAVALRHVIVEFDAYDGDIWEAVSASYRYLADRGYA